MEHTQEGYTPTDHHEDEVHLFWEIARTNHAMLAAFGSVIGISAAKVQALHAIVGEERGIGVMDLARRLNVDAAAVSRLVKELEEQGWLERRPDPRDRRRSTVLLSADGHTRFQSVHLRGHEFEKALSDEIGAERIATAVEVLANVRVLIEEIMRRGLPTRDEP